MIKTLLLSFVIFVSGLFVYLYFYLGAYKPVTIAAEARGPLHLLYKDHIGAYHEIGPTISAVEAFALRENLPCPYTFGEYLDDPKAVDQDRLRSRGGCLLSASPQNPPAEFHFEDRAAQNYLVAHFEGSPAIGPFKVYPSVQKYLSEHRLKASPAVMEVYLVNGTKVTTDYLFNIENQ